MLRQRAPKAILIQRKSSNSISSRLERKLLRHHESVDECIHLSDGSANVIDLRSRYNERLEMRACSASVTGIFGRYRTFRATLSPLTTRQVDNVVRIAHSCLDARYSEINKRVCEVKIAIHCWPVCETPIGCFTHSYGWELLPNSNFWTAIGNAQRCFLEDTRCSGTA